jgi:nitrogen-specific signal transduction histidine kinase/CheY-like chemotaxis protein
MRTQRPPLYLAIVQDITELKQKDALLRQSQKMEVIGQLTGGIAHDFNNLLTVILGNNELLAGRLGDDDRARKFLDAASGAAERGAQLTSQLLSFARQQPLDAKVIDVNALAFGMQDMLQRTLGETIIVELDLAPDLGKAQADPAQLHNALLNLAINAKDAMPNGGRLIIETSNINFDPAAAKTCVDVEAGHYVRLSVSDTGCGMPPDVQARVFEPFFTTKEKGKGTGLGLSMVQGFAKQSGGHLDLYSEPGHGTTVNIYLPDASADAELISPDDAPSPTMDAQGETVLVVEDDYRVRHITVARLEHLGYQVVEAENGQQALDVLGDGYTVDVVLTDMVMPGGMTGADLIRHVREKYPQMKIGFTSGYAEGSQLPVDGAPWLYKPYPIDELARTLRQLLD